MTRKILLICNPGFEGSDNYAQQVYNVRSMYKDFFLSPAGGGYLSGEIIEYVAGINHANDETLLSFKILEVDDAEYTVIVFIGHGRFDGNDRIQLPSGVEWPIDSFYITKKPQSKLKRTVIIDSCRVETENHYPQILNEGFDSRAQDNLNFKACRDYFDSLIEDTPAHIDLVQSTHKGCPAYLTNDGTLFGYRLFNYVSSTVQSWNIAGMNSNQVSPDMISNEEVVKVLEKTMKNDGQLPQYTPIMGQGCFPFMICRFY